MFTDLNKEQKNLDIKCSVNNTQKKASDHGSFPHFYERQAQSINGVLNPIPMHLKVNFYISNLFLNYYQSNKEQTLDNTNTNNTQNTENEQKYENLSKNSAFKISPPTTRRLVYKINNTLNIGLNQAGSQSLCYKTDNSEGVLNNNYNNNQNIHKFFKADYQKINNSNNFDPLTHKKSQNKIKFEINHNESNIKFVEENSPHKSENSILTLRKRSTSSTGFFSFLPKQNDDNNKNSSLQNCSEAVIENKGNLSSIKKSINENNKSINENNGAKNIFTCKTIPLKRTIKRRFRKNIDQIKFLTDFYKQNKNWTKSQVQEISLKTGLKENKVYKWLWDQKNKDYKVTKFVVKNNTEKHVDA